MSSGRAGSTLALLLLLTSSSPAVAQRAIDPQCDVVTPLTPVANLREGSGLARSRRLPTRLFTLNDSADPELLVLNVNGTPRGTVTVTNASVIDWEDVTSGSCPGGICLYVGDIGDNAGNRPTITVYRILEPRDGERQAAAVRFDAVYPDGPRDAEAMFTDAAGRLYLITKDARGAGLYAFPERLVPDVANRLTRVATLDAGTGRLRFARITDAEASADGRTVAVRSNDALFLLPTAALVAGRLSEASVFSLRPLGEPQGEGVALGDVGDVFLVGEGGGRRGTGTFARLSCMAAPRPLH